jgi:hypothetical protein
MRADLSVDYLRDTKVLRLWRECGPGAVLMHLATVLDTWREGERVSIHDTTVDAVDPAIVEVMQRLDLLDAEGRIPLDSWESWIAPSVELMASRRAAGRAAAVRRWHSDRSPNRSPIGSPNTQTDSQTDSHRARARARENGQNGGSPQGGGLMSFREAMVAAGYAAPMSLENDKEEQQQA